MAAEQGTDLGVRQNVIQSHFITTFFFLSLDQYCVVVPWVPGLAVTVAGMGYILWSGPEVTSVIGWLQS